MRIGIVIGSVRPGRLGASVGAWVADRARALDTSSVPGGVEWTVLDLRDFDLPVMTDENWAQAEDGPAEVHRWRDAVAECDGFVFISPEYNRNIPGAFKNAYDLLSRQWMDKTLAIVAYGGLGGVRANEAWRITTAAYNMHVVGDSVNLVRRMDFPGGELALTDHHDRSLEKVLRRLVDLTRALAGDRAATGP
ncbi:MULTISPECIES: NAD(P)H-dependent oxidoreductase [Micrococcaceae]|jgi:NAD(P)H-dependent FMN reductase|uniref:NADPH-dependent FMN reductase n=1 Tax=Micrococcaceae TaxID=1268 RepID=UPI001616FEA8|nr:MULTISPECIES: NAD(P)H-dependent oxidoreductase [Micrococcaceae]MBB5750604.1 NAD(P)H-dependent FMN reductase [Micrococcus sp. TA1]HRO92363.1 NAD(P)H-dependent oxidoreductase [Citricoccus sp.]